MTISAPCSTPGADKVSLKTPAPSGIRISCCRRRAASATSALWSQSTPSADPRPGARGAYTPTARRNPNRIGCGRVGANGRLPRGRGDSPHLDGPRRHPGWLRTLSSPAAFPTPWKCRDRFRRRGPRWAAFRRGADQARASAVLGRQPLPLRHVPPFAQVKAFLAGPRHPRSGDQPIAKAVRPWSSDQISKLSRSLSDLGSSSQARQRCGRESFSGKRSGRFSGDPSPVRGAEPTGIPDRRAAFPAGRVSRPARPKLATDAADYRPGRPTATRLRPCCGHAIGSGGSPALL